MIKTLTTLAFLVLLTGAAFAHEGHDEAPGADGGPQATFIELSDSAAHNLGIETVIAAIAPQTETLELNATVSFLPERQAQVSPRIEGKVAEIFVKVGDAVQKGQVLLSVQPNFIGSHIVELTSPISGFVTRQNAVIGQSISPENALMEVADPTKVLVNGKAFETPQLARLASGQKVTVRTPVFGDKLFSGTVQRLDIELQGNNRTLSVFALVDNPERKLLAGMQAVMSVAVSGAEEILAVPAKAILGEGGEYFLFIRSGKQFERRSVTLGKKFGTMQEIVEGVFPDEQVVIQGQYQLQFAKPAQPKKEEAPLQKEETPIKKEESPPQKEEHKDDGHSH